MFPMDGIWRIVGATLAVALLIGALILCHLLRKAATARVAPTSANSGQFQGLPLLINRNITLKIALVSIIVLNGYEVNIYSFLCILASEGAIPGLGGIGAVDSFSPAVINLHRVVFDVQTNG